MLVYCLRNGAGGVYICIHSYVLLRNMTSNIMQRSGRKETLVLLKISLTDLAFYVRKRKYIQLTLILDIAYLCMPRMSG